MNVNAVRLDLIDVCAYQPKKLQNWKPTKRRHSDGLDGMRADINEGIKTSALLFAIMSKTIWTS